MLLNYKNVLMIMMMMTTMTTIILGRKNTDFKNKTYEMVHKKFNDILSINSSVNTSNSFGSLVGLDLPNGEDPLLASESCQRC